MPVRLLAAVVVCAFGAGPALAASCSLVLQSGGTLSLSADGHHLGSDQTGGHSASVTVTSDEGNTLTVSAPTLVQAPTGYEGLVPEVAYRGEGALASTIQSYTTAQTQIITPDLTSSASLTIDNRITTTTGLASGTYETRTVVTCS